MLSYFKALSRLSRLEEDLARCERNVAGLRTSWDDFQENASYTLKRTARERRRIEDLSPGEAQVEAEGVPKPDAFSTRAQTINDMILARRNRRAM